LHWYKVPVRKALLVLYFGTLKYSEVANNTAAMEAEKFSKTHFLKESDTTGEPAVWCNLAYDLAQKTAAPIFEKMAGSAMFTRVKAFDGEQSFDSGLA
jgi:hypothetical protein